MVTHDLIPWQARPNLSSGSFTSPSSPLLPKIQFNHQSLTDHAELIQLSNTIASPSFHSHRNSPPHTCNNPWWQKGFPAPLPSLSSSSQQPVTSYCCSTSNMVTISWVLHFPTLHLFVLSSCINLLFPGLYLQLP